MAISQLGFTGQLVTAPRSKTNRYPRRKAISPREARIAARVAKINKNQYGEYKYSAD